MYEFKLPDLGEGIHEGELLQWHVKVGETIAEDAPLVDIETDKASVTIPSPRGGKVVSLAGEVGDTLSVGGVLVVIDDGSGAQSPPAAATESKTEATPPAKAAEATAGVRNEETKIATEAPASSEPVAAAPATRRRAREMGIDIRRVPGSGPGGRITREDLENFAGDPSRATRRPATAATGGGDASGIPYLELDPLPDFSEFGPVEIEAVRSIRRKVARKMTTSMILVPHVALMDEADVTELEAFRRAERKKRGGEPGGKLTLLPFVARALVDSLADFPAFNSSFDAFNEEIIYKKYYNVGIAVDSGKGLIVPVVKGADRQSVLEISAEIERLALEARDGKINVADLRGSTITITNVGPLGGTNLIPTINYPEVAILAMGRTAERPVVVDGEVVVRSILPLTLAFDHRVADGADAARFMQSLIKRLTNPLGWLLERR